MFVSDLLGRPVRSGDTEVGVIVDARFAVGDDGAAELVGFVVGHRPSVAVRRFFAHRSDDGFFVPWGDVEDVAETVSLRPGFARGPR